MTHTLVAVIAVVTMALAASGLGRRIGVAVLGDADRALLALSAPALGLALVSIGSLLVLLVGGLPPQLHWLLPAVGLGFALKDRESCLSDWGVVRSELGRSAGAVFAVASLATVVLLLFAVGPVVDWDSLAFHDRVLQQFVVAGKLFVPEDNLHVAQLGLAQMATMPLRIAGLANPGAMISLGSTTLAIVVAAVAAARLGGAAAAILAASAVAGSPLLLLVGMTPRVDAPLTLLVLLTLLALASDLLENGTARLRWTIALAGVAAGTKYHGIAFAGLVALVVAGRWRSLPYRSMLPGVAIGIVMVAPWLVLNQLHFGAPLFPFLAPPVLESWLADLAGSAVLPAGFDNEWQALMVQARERFSPLAFLFDPQRLTLESEGLWYRPSLLLLLIPAALLVRPWRAIVAWGVIPIGYLAVVLLISPATSPRYLLPGAIPLLVAVAAGVTVFLNRVVSGPGRLVGAFLILLALGQSILFTFTWVTPAVLGHAAGLASPAEFQEGHPDITVRRFAAIPALIEAQVPPSGSLLMLFDARGGGIGRHVVADARAALWPVLAQTSSPARCLAGTGITHVLLNVGTLDFYLARGVSSNALKVDALRSFLARCGELRAEHAGFLLFQVQAEDSLEGAGS